MKYKHNYFDSTLSNEEKELITFLYQYRLYSETEANEHEMVNYLNGIDGDYKEMFISSNCYHDDDRLTISEKRTIIKIYTKLNRISKM